MNTTTRLIITVASLLFLFSLSCGLFSQLIGENTQVEPAPEEPAVSESVETEAEESITSEETEPEEVPAAQSEPELTSDALVPPPPDHSNACANTFYPMIPGHQWIYEATSEGETSKISLTVSEVNGNQATLNILYLQSGVTNEVTVECLDGAIINFPVLLLGFLFGDVDGQISIEHVDGVYAPNYETLAKQNWNHEWSGNYLASGTIEAEIEGDAMTGILEESPINMQWNTLGAGEAIFEPVTVQAGEYNRAIKLEREVELDITAEIVEEGQSVSVSAVLILENNLWFEANVGQLKQEIENASVKLYGINFPVEMTGTVELVEFRSGE
jgi:hypothetical protein